MFSVYIQLLNKFCFEHSPDKIVWCFSGVLGVFYVLQDMNQKKFRDNAKEKGTTRNQRNRNSF